MKTLKSSPSIIVFISVVCFFLNPTLSFAKIHHLTILHTNNHHGHFMKFDQYPMIDVGGMAARSTLINIVRAEVEEAGGHVLLLSAGEVNIGTPESDLLNAEPDFKLMNMLSYDAMTLGNIDISGNSVEMLMQQREWAGFPFLSANIVKKETGKLLVDPYMVKELDGLRIAIFGLTIEGDQIFSKYSDNLETRNVIETARRLVPKLRTEADLVIALTHIGFHETSNLLRTPGDILLAKQIPGIDVIVGGQSRTVLERPEVIGDTLIVQAGTYGLYVGRLDLTIDSETHTVTASTYKLIPVNLKERVKYHDKSYYMYIDKGYVEDPAVLEFVQPYLAKVEDLLSQPVGEALVGLNGDMEFVRYQETNLANLITDGMRAKTGAEITFQNAGGIRSGIEAGPVTYRDILAVLPFRDTLVLLDMTGEQVMDILSYAATINPGSSKFLHVSGVKWTNMKGIPEDVMVGDAPIESERMYKVVTNSYLATGGDGYSMFKDLPQYDTGFIQASALREHFLKLGKVAPKVEGRLTIIK